MVDDNLSYITVENFHGKWILVDPYGKPFISKAVCYVNCNGEVEKETKINHYKMAVEKAFKSKERWSVDTTNRLRELGFNTVGPWSNEELFKDKMYYITLINLARDNWETGTPDDYFSDSFYEYADNKARKEITKNNYRYDKFLIGYCTGAEMRWGSDWRKDKSIVFDYLNFPGDKEGKIDIINFFKEIYKGDIKEFSRHWRQCFNDWDEAVNCQEYKEAIKDARFYEEEALYFISKRYFKTAYDIIKKYDKHHLLLETRFVATSIPRSVLKACSEYVDVVSVNHYELMFGMHKFMPLLAGTTKTTSCLKEFYEITKKPLLITEFGYRVKAEDGRKMLPMGFSTFSDRKRGKKIYKYIRNAMNTNYIVGYHVFQWFDQPPKGRFDSQNSNFGIVNIQNEIYKDYAYYLKKANELPISNSLS